MRTTPERCDVCLSTIRRAEQVIRRPVTGQEVKTPRTVKALLITSDPYEPSGVIGLFETEQQRQVVIDGYKESCRQICHENNKVAWAGTVLQAEDIEKYVERQVAELQEITIPIGVYGEYY